MTRYLVRPGLSQVWHPHRPVSILRWEASDAELRYRAGRMMPRKRPTDTHAVCLGGPCHGDRVLSRHYQGRGEQRRLLAELLAEFTVPPWRGSYRRVKEGIYGFCDESFGLSDHRRRVEDEEAKTASRLAKKGESSAER